MRCYGGAVTNSILCLNTVGSTPNDINTGFENFHYSCSPDLSAGVNHNIVDDPSFRSAGPGSGTNAVAGDYRSARRQVSMSQVSSQLEYP